MLAPQLGYGGAEQSFVRLANYLSRYHDVNIALFTRCYGRSDYVNNAERPICPVTVLDEAAKGRLGRWLARWRRLRNLKRKSDVAISFLTGPNLLNVLAGGATPSIVSERGSKGHNTLMTSRQRIFWTRLVDPLIYRFATSIVPASEGLAREIEAGRERALSGKIVAIEGYVDTAAAVEAADSELSPEYETLCRWPLIVTCGRLSREKGYDFLISVMARVKRKVPEAKLLIIGDGPERKALEAHAHEVGLTYAGEATRAECADVIFSGYLENPIRYFQLGQVFAFPSRFEGLPNALIEALAAGVPAVAADCPWGPRSVLAHDKAASRKIADGDLPLELERGVLMPRIDTPAAMDAWTDVLTACLQSPRRRRNRADRAAAVARFDIERSGLLWLDLIERVSRRETEREQCRAPKMGMP